MKICWIAARPDITWKFPQKFRIATLRRMLAKRSSDARRLLFRTEIS